MCWWAIWGKSNCIVYTQIQQVAPKLRSESNSYIWAAVTLNFLAEGRASKNWCFQTVVLEKTLESPLDSKETKPVNSKGNRPWIFIGRTDAEAEVPILWPLDAKSQLIGKDPDDGKDWRQEEKWATEDEKIGWRHQLNGHEFEQTPGDSEGQGSLACCSPRGCRVRLDLATEQQQQLHAYVNSGIGAGAGLNGFT